MSRKLGSGFSTQMNPYPTPLFRIIYVSAEKRRKEPLKLKHGVARMGISRGSPEREAAASSVGGMVRDPFRETRAPIWVNMILYHKLEESSLSSR